MPLPKHCLVSGEWSLLVVCECTWQVYADEVTKQGLAAAWDAEEKKRDSAGFFDILSVVGLYGNLDTGAAPNSFTLSMLKYFPRRVSCSVWFLHSLTLRMLQSDNNDGSGENRAGCLPLVKACVLMHVAHSSH